MQNKKELVEEIESKKDDLEKENDIRTVEPKIVDVEENQEAVPNIGGVDVQEPPAVDFENNMKGYLTSVHNKNVFKQVLNIKNELESDLLRLKEGKEVSGDDFFESYKGLISCILNEQVGILRNLRFTTHNFSIWTDLYMVCDLLGQIQKRVPSNQCEGVMLDGREWSVFNDIHQNSQLDSGYDIFLESNLDLVENLIDVLKDLMQVDVWDKCGQSFRSLDVIKHHLDQSKSICGDLKKSICCLDSMNAMLTGVRPSYKDILTYFREKSKGNDLNLLFFKSVESFIEFMRDPSFNETIYWRQGNGPKTFKELENMLKQVFKNANDAPTCRRLRSCAMRTKQCCDLPQTMLTVTNLVLTITNTYLLIHEKLSGDKTFKFSQVNGFNDVGAGLGALDRHSLDGMDVTQLTFACASCAVSALSLLLHYSSNYNNIDECVELDEVRVVNDNTESEENQRLDTNKKDYGSFEDSSKKSQ